MYCEEDEGEKKDAKPSCSVHLDFSDTVPEWANIYNIVYYYNR